MKSSDKLDVRVGRFAAFRGKLWVKVKYKGNSSHWIPSFEDLFRIVQAICYCEDRKYPYGAGREMVRRFLSDACNDGINFEALREKYQIPKRE